jgi:hypothetical protein
MKVLVIKLENRSNSVFRMKSAIYPIITETPTIIEVQIDKNGYLLEENSIIEKVELSKFSYTEMYSYINGVYCHFIEARVITLLEESKDVDPDDDNKEIDDPEEMEQYWTNWLKNKTLTRIKDHNKELKQIFNEITEL